MARTFDPADEYAVRTVWLAGQSDGDDLDPEEEAYWDSLLVWVDNQRG